jgi:hypothetical protein
MTFKQLPIKYAKAFDSSLITKRSLFFRESVISKWIAIPANSKLVFKDYKYAHRIKNIYAKTKEETVAELQIYLNNHGLIGISINANLEDLVLESIDTNSYVIEKVPISPFLTGYVDLDDLAGFEEITDYLDSLYTIEVYTIDNNDYYSLLTLCDEKCIAINNEKSVFRVNRQTGQVKLISKTPKDFIKSFKNNQLDWLELT